MAFCTGCGTKLLDGDRLCTLCGQATEEKVSQQTSSKGDSDFSNTTEASQIPPNEPRQIISVPAQTTGDNSAHPPINIYIDNPQSEAQEEINPAVNFEHSRKSSIARKFVAPLLVFVGVYLSASNPTLKDFEKFAIAEVKRANLVAPPNSVLSASEMLELYAYGLVATNTRREGYFFFSTYTMHQSPMQYPDEQRDAKFLAVGGSFIQLSKSSVGELARRGLENF